MKTIWLLAIIVSISTTDLPSCKRARCSHCSLEFISKTCQKTCHECPRIVLDKVTGKKIKVYPENYHPLPVSSSHKTQKVPFDEKRRQTSSKDPEIGVVPRQSGVATQTKHQFSNSNVANQALQPVQPPVSQSYFPGNQFNQPSVDLSTLAPLIPPPRPTDINRNLAQQPADLAHPLTEYQQSAQNVGPFNQQQQQPTVFQTPAQPQLYNTNQNSFTQPTMTDIFGQPLFQAQPPQPLQFTQPQQQNPLMNPFQTFGQQPPSQQSMLDPFGLLNLVGMTQGTQGTALRQTPATSGSYSQPQIAYGVAPVANQQPFVNPQQNFQQNPQPNYYGHQQNYYNNQRPNAHQNVHNYYQKPAPQQVAPNLVARDYSSQNYRSHLQQGNGNQQRIRGTKAQSNIFYPANQAHVHQPNLRQQVASALPPVSSSIDATPINVQKYVDGKGVVPTYPPQQCPRQPGWSPCITKQAANERFVNCCARLGEGCLPLCNYDAQLSTMQLAVLTGRCPLTKMADIMVCASGYEDATPCCEAYNVFERGYEHCRPYCNPAAGLPSGGLLSEKYKCLVKLSTIQQCFYVSQKP